MFAYICSENLSGSQAHFGFSNMSSKMHSFSATATYFQWLYNKTPCCSSLNYCCFTVPKSLFFLNVLGSFTEDEGKILFVWFSKLVQTQAVVKVISQMLNCTLLMARSSVAVNKDTLISIDMWEVSWLNSKQIGY